MVPNWALRATIDEWRKSQALSPLPPPVRPALFPPFQKRSALETAFLKGPLLLVCVGSCAGALTAQVVRRVVSDPLSLSMFIWLVLALAFNTGSTPGTWLRRWTLLRAHQLQT